MQYSDWKADEALQILELICVRPTVVLDKAAQVLKMGDHFNRLTSWDKVDGCRTLAAGSLSGRTAKDLVF